MNFQFLSYFSLECLCLYLYHSSNLQGWILTPPSNLPFEKGPALQSSYVKRPLLAQYLKTNPYLTFFYLDFCIMPSTLGKQTCPRNHANKLAEKCVAKYITAKSCKAAVGIWKKFTTNYVGETSRDFEHLSWPGRYEAGKRGSIWTSQAFTRSWSKETVCSPSKTPWCYLRAFHCR